MKKNLLCLALALAAMLKLGACASGDSKKAAAKVEFETIEWHDSVLFESGASTKVDMSLKIPKNDGTPLARNVRRWVQEQLSTLSVPFDVLTGSEVWPENQADAINQQNQASQQKLEEEVKLIGEDLLESDCAVLQEYGTEDIEYGFVPFFSLEVNIEVEYEDRQFVTLAYTAYEFQGGMHGSTYKFFATFRKADGHKMDWQLLEGMTHEQITDSIKLGLCQYFGVSIDELPSQLQLPNEDDVDLPLPATPPYLNADGVNIVYQQYEICCYAWGMPTCVVKHYKPTE